MVLSSSFVFDFVPILPLVPDERKKYKMNVEIHTKEDAKLYLLTTSIWIRLSETTRNFHSEKDVKLHS